MGILFEDLKDSGCTFVGAVPDSDYTYASSWPQPTESSWDWPLTT